MKKRLLTLIIILVIVIFAGFVNAENQTCKGEGVKISQLETNILCCDGLTKILPKWEGILSIDGICTAKCGNGVCDEETESSYNCPQDCKSTAPICGNNICEEKEAKVICPQDCKEDCGELKKQINQLTSQAQSCNKDSDCVFDNNFLSCQNVCGIPRNKNTDISELKEITSKFDKDCAKGGCPGYGCLNDYLVKCVGGKCQKALNKSCVCTQDAKICPDGSAVSRVCPDCEFASCENKNNKIKILPETASLRARERLGELGFNISLKEVGKGNNTRMVYEVRGKKQGKMFGLFKVKGKVSAEVDAETGEVVGIKKPWWAFLARGI